MDRFAVVSALVILPIKLPVPRDESSLYLQKLHHNVADLNMKMYILTFKLHLLTFNLIPFLLAG